MTALFTEHPHLEVEPTAPAEFRRVPLSVDEYVATLAELRSLIAGDAPV